MRRLWCYKLFDAALFYGLCALVKLQLGFSWIEKGGLFLNVALFMGPQYTEWVDGKQQKGFYVVSYSDEPCIKMVIFLYVPSELVWKYFVMDLVRGWGGGQGGERSEHVTHVVYETLKQWKLS